MDKISSGFFWVLFTVLEPDAISTFSRNVAFFRKSNVLDSCFHNLAVRSRLLERTRRNRRVPAKPQVHARFFEPHFTSTIAT
jgi:hypothetical protein